MRMKIRRALLALLLVVATSTSFAKPESKGPDPDAILRNLYKAHDANKGPFADKQNRAELNRYFTKELADLILMDAVQADGEVGAYEFDPLYESQAPEVEEFKVGKVYWGGIVKHEGDEPEDGLAVVEVTFKERGQSRSIPFRFQQEPDETWRIADINYSDGRTLAGLIRDAYTGEEGVK